MSPLQNQHSFPESEDFVRAKDRLNTATELVGSGQGPMIQQALALASETIDRWKHQESTDQPAVTRLLATAWLVMGNALRETGNTALRSRALEAYAKALEKFQAVMESDNADDINHLANLWTNRGMVLLDDGSAPALTEALPCFEKAIELRRHLPLQDKPDFIWGLSAAWMNCADVLTRLGGKERLDQAITGYDEAIALLGRLPVEERASYRTRLALAWMNRGIAAATKAHEHPTPESLAEALRCFSACIEQLAAASPSLNPEQRRVLSCAYLNHGHASLNNEPPLPEQAREDAMAAMALAVEFEKQEVLAAQIGLQARHLLCRAVAFLVDMNRVPGDWILETTDAVDEGMALARHWRQSGEPGLRTLEAELFRFGALIYRMCQPHFLGEFLLECIDPHQSPGAPVAEEVMHHIATDAMWSAIVDIRAQQQADASPENQARLMERLEDIQEVEKRMSELRMAYLAPKGQ